MKNKTLFFLLSCILFVALLYNQVPGFNFLIFSIYMLGLSHYLDHDFTGNSLTIAVFLLITTFSVAYFGDPFSVFLSVFLFFLLPVFNAKANEYLFLAPIKSGFSYLLSFTQVPQAIKDMSRAGKSDNNYLKFVSYILVPIFVIGLFLFFYSAVNVDFKNTLGNFDLPDLNTQFIIISMAAVFYCFGFFHFKNWLPEKYYASFLQMQLHPMPAANKNTEDIWTNSGIILFTILDFLLLTLLYFELKEITSSSAVTYIREYSANVHKSTNAVVASIFFAEILIMLYFGGRLNFSSKSKKLKDLSYTWLVFNGSLLLTTLAKNNIYVNHLGLTYYRLGVYAFLFLSLIGLIYTFIKIKYNKSNFYLINTMSWVFLTFAVGICPINWSRVVTAYNLQQYEEANVSLDVSYLESLDYNDIQMIDLYNQHPELFNNTYSKPMEIAESKSELTMKESFLSDNFYNQKLRKKYGFPMYSKYHDKRTKTE